MSQYPEQGRGLSPATVGSPLQLARNSGDVTMKAAMELNARLRLVRDRIVGTRPEKAQGMDAPPSPSNGVLSEMVQRFTDIGEWINASGTLVSELLEATET